MQDFVPLGTGNSRSLKSSISAGTTWEQTLEMLRNGTFPIDIGAVNDAGVAQKGSPINKTTLLKDATASLFQLGADAVPDDVLEILSKAALVGEDGGLVTASGLVASSIKIQVVSYVGTGKYGASNPCSLSFGFSPDAIIFLYRENTSGNIDQEGAFASNGIPFYKESLLSLDTSYKQYRGFSTRTSMQYSYAKTNEAKNQIVWYDNYNYGEISQLNISGYKYTFLALKFITGGSA